MIIDKKTKEKLDLERVLENLHPITPFGIQLKNEMQPFKKEEKEELETEYQRIEKIIGLVDTQRAVFVEMRTHMRGIKDLRRSIKNSMENRVLTLVELFEIKILVLTMRSLAMSQSQLHWEIPDKYKIRPLEKAEKILDPENYGLKTFYIYDCYSQALTEIRKTKTEIERKLGKHRKERIKEIENETGIEMRSNGEFTIGRKEESIIGRLNEYSKLQISSETYINITYKIRPDTKMADLLKEIEDLKEKESLEEMQVLKELTRKIASLGEELLKNIDAIGNFDLIISKAYLANSMKAVKPKISDEIKCTIKNGRHPIVERGLSKKGKTFTPISIELDQGLAIITGANMGGKTVSLKMVGTLLLMMQYGLFVPADYMESSLMEFVFISAGDEQSLDTGLSTFGAEIKAMKDMLLMSDKQGLILIDELARGTNPREGYAISYGIIKYLYNKPSITLITTHFDGLVKEGIKHFQVKGLRNLDYDKVGNPEIISSYMDYRLIEIKEQTDVPKDAIKISRLIGIPEEILEEAERIIK